MQTREEALKFLKPTPQNRVKPIIIRISADIKKKGQQSAKKHNTNFTRYVESAIYWYTQVLDGNKNT